MQEVYMIIYNLQINMIMKTLGYRSIITPQPDYPAPQSTPEPLHEKSNVMFVSNTRKRVPRNFETNSEMKRPV